LLGEREAGESARLEQRARRAPLRHDQEIEELVALLGRERRKRGERPAYPRLLGAQEA
jgi:hypothetical protein